MAFNPLSGFQKNKRFWMAAILMICMVTFVFCTGLQGDMADRLLRMIGRGGTTIARVNGRALTDDELRTLKLQRNFANEYILTCSEIAYRKLTRNWYEESVKFEADQGKEKQKELQSRAGKLAQMKLMIDTIAYRKNKQNKFYFEGGVKLDELIEFKLWLAQADRLGVYLDNEHVKYLFRMEFFDQLAPEEIRAAEYQAMRGNARDMSMAMKQKALTDEFRVRIAQLATIGAQPLSYLARRDEKFTLKFDDPDMPNEVRAPLTLGQIYDYYQKERGQFNVTLFPFDVNEFAKQIEKLPTDDQRRIFFDANKDKPADPSSDVWGLERPAQIKLEFLIADPSAAPGEKEMSYVDLAKVLATLKTQDPLAYYNALQSPLSTIAHYGAVQQKQQIDLERHRENLVSNLGLRGAALFSEKDFTTPIMHRLAQKHPEAIASLFGNLLGASATSPLDVSGATAGYLAWAPHKHADQLQAAIDSEARRRSPSAEPGNNAYADALRWSFTLDPFNTLVPYLTFDAKNKTYLFYQNKADQRALLDNQLMSPEVLEQFLRINLPGMGQWAYQHPSYTTETIQHEIKDIVARQVAEEWAQASIREIRRELEKAAGDAEKYRRVLNKQLPHSKLLYGPPEAKKELWYNRFTVQTAPELEPLRKAFEEYVNQVNWYEGRDLTPEKMLKPGDFYKMFFESGENFSSTAAYRVRAWPPEVKGNSARVWKKVDPRLISGIDPEKQEKLVKQLLGQDVNKEAMSFDLFVTATKPMLYWRTADLPPQRYPEYEKFVREKKQDEEALAKIKVELKNKDAANLQELKKREADLERKLADYKATEERLIEGWKLEEARTPAIAAAKNKAEEVLKELVGGADRERLDVRLAINGKFITLPDVSPLHAEVYGSVRDYGKYPLPKDKIAHPREDMVDHVVKLLDLKEPVKVGVKELDELNKQLFDEANRKPTTGNFVQILANKPRTMFYVAFVSRLPQPNSLDAARGLQDALQNARNTGGQRIHDLLLERAQRDHAKTMWASYVRNLEIIFNYEPPAAEIRSKFEDRGE